MIRFKNKKFIRDIAQRDYPFRGNFIDAFRELRQSYKEEKEVYGEDHRGLWNYLVGRIDFIRDFHNQCVYPLRYKVVREVRRGERKLKLKKVGYRVYW